MLGQTILSAARGSCKTRPHWLRPGHELSFWVDHSQLAIFLRAEEGNHILVPALERRARQSRFGNCDMLLFTPGHSAYKLVSNFGVDGVTDPVHGHDDIAEMLTVPIQREQAGLSNGLTGWGHKIVEGGGPTQRTLCD